jgi:hypothetical protein
MEANRTRTPADGCEYEVVRCGLAVVIMPRARRRCNAADPSTVGRETTPLRLFTPPPKSCPAAVEPWSAG